MRSPDPSYAQGFARYWHESERPDLWEGLVGLWAPYLGPTGLTLFDWSGCRNHGTISGATWAVNDSGYYLDFLHANDGLVLIPASTSIRPLGNFTIICDIILRNVTGNDHECIWNFYSSATDRAHLKFEGDDSGNLRFFDDIDDAGAGYSSASFTSPGVRYSIVTTVIGGTWTIYANGISRISQALGKDLSDLDSSMIIWIGNNHGAGNQALDGSLGPSMLYNRALTLSEIMDIHIDPKAILRKRVPVFYSVAAAPAAVVKSWMQSHTMLMPNYEEDYAAYS